MQLLYRETDTQLPVSALVKTPLASLKLKGDAEKSPPKQSADADLQKRVHNHLLSRLLSTVHHLKVDVANGVVTLRGTVNSFYQKQLCIHTCQRVSGVVRLIDRTEVR